MALERLTSNAYALRSLAAYRAAVSAISEISRAPVTPRPQARTALQAEAPRLTQRQFRSRRREVAQQNAAHDVAVYLAAVAWNVPARALARVSGQSERSVRRALRAIEDWRDAAPIDRTLSELEGRLVA